MAELQAIASYLNQYLQVDQYRDYCPNGLQVEGRAQINKVVSGVTANQALIDAAIKVQADMIIVHHGFFWKNEPAVITGIKAKRLAALLKNEINLLAYHLPLDGNLKIGNNILFAQKLGIDIQGEIASGAGKNIIMYGECPQALSAETMRQRLISVTQVVPIYIAAKSEPIKKVAWCTGAGQDFFELAIAQGVDAFITGEISERTVHLAREYQVDFFAAGHHAMERYGIQALGDVLANEFKIEHVFIDIESPV